MVPTTLSSKIYGMFAREILDSRGNPTIETTVVSESGYRGGASVPAGASLGKYEARELRDGDKTRYSGMGVTKAVTAVNTTIAAKLKGADVTNQREIDRVLCALDGTEDKHSLGANSILSVSLAASACASALQRIPLYKYFNTMMNERMPVPLQRIPTPTVNVINGGKHGAGNLDFQEFHIVSASGKSFHDALRLSVEIYHSLKAILIYRNAIHSVGDEGGFAPNLFTNLDALELLQEAIRATPYRLGVDVFFGLDIAASHFKNDRGYQIKDKPTPLAPKDFISYIEDLHKSYRLLMLEDPLYEDDWTGWQEITRRLGSDVMIVGDDFLATNKKRLERAIADKACTAILVKPNQIGTLSEFLDVVALAKKNNVQAVVSHRSGETNDTIIADLGVGVQADYVKFGAPARGERVAKYNRLLQIEAELFSQK